MRELLLEPEQLLEELNPPSDERRSQIDTIKQQFLNAFDGYEDLRREFVAKGKVNFLLNSLPSVHAIVHNIS